MFTTCNLQGALQLGNDNLKMAPNVLFCLNIFKICRTGMEKKVCLRGMS